MTLNLQLISTQLVRLQNYLETLEERTAKCEEILNNDSGSIPPAGQDDGIEFKDTNILLVGKFAPPTNATGMTYSKYTVGGIFKNINIYYNTRPTSYAYNGSVFLITSQSTQSAATTNKAAYNAIWNGTNSTNSYINYLADDNNSLHVKLEQTGGSTSSTYPGYGMPCWGYSYTDKKNYFFAPCMNKSQYTYRIAYSPDGINWKYTFSGGPSITNICYGHYNGRKVYVMTPFNVGSLSNKMSNIMYSYDPLYEIYDNTVFNVPDNATYSNKLTDYAFHPNAIAFGEGGFVAGILDTNQDMNSGEYFPYLIHSDDGINWSPYDSSSGLPQIITPDGGNSGISQPTVYALAYNANIKAYCAILCGVNNDGRILTYSAYVNAYHETNNRNYTKWTSMPTFAASGHNHVNFHITPIGNGFAVSYTEVDGNNIGSVKYLLSINTSSFNNLDTSDSKTKRQSLVLPINYECIGFCSNYTDWSTEQFMAQLFTKSTG